MAGAGCAAQTVGVYLMKVRAHQYDTVDALAFGVSLLAHRCHGAGN